MVLILCILLGFESVLFQLRLVGVFDCERWIVSYDVLHKVLNCSLILQEMMIFFTFFSLAIKHSYQEGRHHKLVE